MTFNSTNNTIASNSFASTTPNAPTPARKSPHAARLMLAMLSKLKHGVLTLQLPDGSVHRFGHSHAHESAQVDSTLAFPLADADIRVHDWALFGAVLRGGDIAFAESFMNGQFSTPHLPNLLKVLVANRHAIESALYGTWWGNVIDRVIHLFRRNSKGQARKNIAAHYDLGNPFYSLWLDDCMTYSAALFDTPYEAQPALDDARLAAAQSAKYQRVLAELTLPANARVLEIGCGWGGFASVAAQAHHRVKGLTLSQEQLAYAQQRMAREGLTQRSQLVLQDYRDEGVNAPAQYDGIASIEMFEAVGEQYWPSYFECLARNLKVDGKACIQSIVINDALFDRYRKGTDFIQRYIFPGGMLPSPATFATAAAAAGLIVVKQHAFGLDYARTLAVWRLRFLKQLAAVKAQGYPEKFIAMWEFYLAYCEAGFVGRDIDVVQFTLVKTKA